MLNSFKFNQDIFFDYKFVLVLTMIFSPVYDNDQYLNEGMNIGEVLTHIRSAFMTNGMGENTLPFLRRLSMHIVQQSS